MNNLRDRFAIVGVGESDQIGKVPGVSSFTLTLQAIRNAMADAGLTRDDIDGVFTFPPPNDPTFMHSAWIAEAIGIRPTFFQNGDLGGCQPMAMVMEAVAAIGAGLCTTAVCAVGFNQMTRHTVPKHRKANMGYENWERPYGRQRAPIAYALVAQRHMHQYGTTSRQLGAIAVANRKHAALNPRAQKREPITLDDHQNSKFVSTPLRALDCCLVSDCGGAVIVTSAERARGLRQKPAYIMGMGMQAHHRRLTSTADITESGARRAGELAYQMAGVGPGDIDLVELYDCFTITSLVQFEDLGFCKKGEGGAFVEGGRIELGGELPYNTDGGLLACTYLEGMGHIIEGVRQVRGEGGERQVPDAEIALITGNAGELSLASAMIIRR